MPNPNDFSQPEDRPSCDDAAGHAWFQQQKAAAKQREKYQTIITTRCVWKESNDKMDKRRNVNRSCSWFWEFN